MESATTPYKEMGVEKEVFYLPKEKKWSIGLRSTEPYGKYFPKTIYISAIFHKKLDKALKIAWDEFYKSKTWQDNKDKFQESRQNEIVKIPV